MTWITGEDHPQLQIETDSADIWYEDDGSAAIVEITAREDDQPFVRIQSWSESGEHPYVESLVGRRVRVTIEVLPPA